jgi:hypothetical protein
MARTFTRTLSSGAIVVAVLFALPAAAEKLLHRAENRVPVAIVQIERPPGHIEIHLQALAALEKVCFAASGPNSPYVLASGRTSRYLGGENVTACPARRDYAAGDIMVLRFEPVDAGSSTFSFVSGPANEKQSADTVSPAAPAWSFIRVQLN